MQGFIFITFLYFLVFSLNKKKIIIFCLNFTKTRKVKKPNLRIMYYLLDFCSFTV